MRITLDMPSVTTCEARQCAYNVEATCHAKAITSPPPPTIAATSRSSPVGLPLKVKAISLPDANAPCKREGRDKPGHDGPSAWPIRRA